MGTGFHVVPLVLPPAGSANIAPIPCWGPSSPLRPLCCLCRVVPWAPPLRTLRLEFCLSQLGSFQEINAFLVSRCFPNQEARWQSAISAPVTTGGNFSTVVRVEFPCRLLLQNGGGRWEKRQKGLVSFQGNFTFRGLRDAALNHMLCVS